MFRFDDIIDAVARHGGTVVFVFVSFVGEREEEEEEEEEEDVNTHTM